MLCKSKSLRSGGGFFSKKIKAPAAQNKKSPENPVIFSSGLKAD